MTIHNTGPQIGPDYAMSWDGSNREETESSLEMETELILTLRYGDYYMDIIITQNISSSLGMCEPTHLAWVSSMVRTAG